MMAPVSPFMSEHIYQEISGKMLSVHAEPWPKQEKALVNKGLERSMVIVKDLIESMNSLREEKKVKLKWPMDAVHVYPGSKEAGKAVKDLSGIIKLIGNVEGVKILTKASKNMKSFPGGKLGLGEVLKDQALVRELVRTVQVLRKKKGLKVTQRILLGLNTDKKTEAVLRGFEKDILQGVGASKISWGVKGVPRGSLSFDGKVVHVGF
jgi:valyl-tRNA synthetase